MKRAAEWFLTLHEIDISAALSLTNEAATTANEPAPAPDVEPDGPALFDTALSADEGVWTRSGWSGRA